MPASQAIFIATGADRPGVLDDVSMFLHEHHADILESRVSLLRGQFGLLLLIRAEDDVMKLIEQGLPVLEKNTNIRTELRPADEVPARDDTPIRLTASGSDSANAVHRLSHLMRVLNVNIENIETRAEREKSQSKGQFSLDMDI